MRFTRCISTRRSGNHTCVRTGVNGPDSVGAPLRKEGRLSVWPACAPCCGAADARSLRVPFAALFALSLRSLCASFAASFAAPFVLPLRFLRRSLCASFAFHLRPLCGRWTRLCGLFCPVCSQSAARKRVSPVSFLVILNFMLFLMSCSSITASVVSDDAWSLCAVE